MSLSVECARRCITLDVRYVEKLHQSVFVLRLKGVQNREPREVDYKVETCWESHRLVGLPAAGAASAHHLTRTVSDFEIMC